ncbi:MAG: hypothetical protein KKB50_18995 [Planctomycetes bacterium]|nr:hypothetical protein [Planctomycetota bacterium]
MALEQVPDLAAVAGEWRSLLGDEYARVGRFLLPTPRIARSVRGAAPGRTCTHEIRQWKRQFLSVCPDGCEPAEVTRDEVTIHRLDTTALAREIAGAFGLEVVAAGLVPNVAGVWMIGDYVPLAGFRFPVFLTLTGEPETLRSALDGLAARGGPFILMAPTRSAFTQVSADVVRQASACFLPLDGLLGDSDNERLALLGGLNVESVLAELRAAHVPQPKDDDGMVFFPTPAGARWQDVSIRFIDRHSVYVTVKGVYRTYHFAQMGMANRKNAKPTVQWELLETFAEGRGLLDWRNRKASRKNQKRRENLAGDLKRFFRIDGDPLVSEGGGWRTRFCVSCST